MASIKSGKIDFPSPDWDDISEDAKDIIRCCLKVHPSDRLTCNQILEHKWLVKECDKNHMAKCQERLKKYTAKRRLKRAQMVIYFSKVMEGKIKMK